MVSTLRSTVAWVLLGVIVLSMMPVAIAFALVTQRSDPHRNRLRSLVGRWISIYGWVSPLYRFEIGGRHHLPAEGPFVLIANHESGLDALCLLMLGSSARFLADDWMFRASWSGWFLRLCGHIPVSRSDPAGREKVLAATEAALRAGSPVAIFPEGRYNEGVLGPFKPGAFVAAKSAGVPIVPVRIEGAGRAWRPGRLVVRGRHVIQLEIQEAISAADVSGSTLESLIDRSRHALASRGSVECS